MPASQFRHRSFSFSLANGDWFYFAGIWRPATPDWPEAYAILTIEANADIAPLHDRQMAVLTRDQRMAWLRQIFALNLRSLRHARGLSQEELAHRAEVHRTYVSALERCYYSPTIDMVDGLTKILDVEAAAMLKPLNREKPLR